jgi:hypothetical protein
MYTIEPYLTYVLTALPIVSCSEAEKLRAPKSRVVKENIHARTMVP